MIQGIIFDMDGVLCDSEDFMAEAGAAMFAETYRVTVQPDEFRPFRGMGEDRYLGGVGKQHGITISLPADKNRAYEIFLHHIKDRLKPLPGALEFTQACRQRGLKMAIASSADRMKLAGMLPEIGLPPERFDAVVTGSDVTHKKPHPEIFLTAAERIGLPAEQCIVVEDAASGVQAARAAGCRCLALTTSLDAGTLRELGADWIALDLAHVPVEMGVG
jgi:HAD superfamily hydrolase (TIGR01509 family)